MNSTKSIRLAVVGNGGTAVDATGRFYVNRHTVRFLMALAYRGYEVTYLEPHTLRDHLGSMQDMELPGNLVRAVAVDKYSPVRLWRAFRTLCRADLVYIFYPGTVPTLAARICRLFRIPYAIYLRGSRFEDSGVDANNLRAARFICCVIGLDGRANWLNRHVIPIRPMVDLNANDALKRDFVARGEQPWRMLFVGRLEADKGVPELIRAAELLQVRGFRFSLTLVGNGPLYKELAGRFGDRPGAAIRISGYVDNKTELHAMFEAADIFVLPTRHEGFPRVLFEAMMKSNVILTTFVGGIPELLQDGYNAWRLPVGDAAGIADVIVAAVADRAHMQTLADAGNATVQQVLASRPTHLNAVLEQLHV